MTNLLGPGSLSILDPYMHSDQLFGPRVAITIRTPYMHYARLAWAQGHFHDRDPYMPVRHPLDANYYLLHFFLFFLSDDFLCLLTKLVNLALNCSSPACHACPLQSPLLNQISGSGFKVTQGCGTPACKINWDGTPTYQYLNAPKSKTGTPT